MLYHAQRLRKIPVLVVGGGVGGLTAALALHRVGQPSHLVMREERLSQSGGAVCLMRGALRILDRLGLGPRIRSIGLPARRGEVFSRKGKRLFVFDLNEEEVYTVPRPRLRQAFLEALPPACVSFDTTFKRLDVNAEQDEGVAVTLRDLRSSSDYQITAETVLGADGGRSAVRSFITPPGASRSTGVTAFRATVHNTDHITYPLHTIREVWGNGRASLRFGYCRMTPTEVYWWANIISAGLPSLTGSMSRGGKSSNIFLRSDIVLRPFGRKLAERFRTFPFDAEPLIASTAETEIERTEIRASGLGENPWLDSTGRVILVGDAARQSDLPYLHHGSSMAIEDGYSLANAVDLSSRAGRSRRPLDAYELERREHTQALHNIWNSFDRLAASRNPVSRYINSKVLSVSLAKHLMESGITTERRQDALAVRRAAPPIDAGSSNGLLPLPPPPPIV